MAIYQNVRVQSRSSQVTKQETKMLILLDNIQSVSQLLHRLFCQVSPASGSEDVS